LEIGQLTSDPCAVSIEACKPLANLCLLRADLVQYRRCCGPHGGLQWFQVDRDDRSCWHLTPQCSISNCRMRRHWQLMRFQCPARSEPRKAMKKLALLDLLTPENSAGADNRRLKVNRACLLTRYNETVHHRLASESIDRDD